MVYFQVLAAVLAVAAAEADPALLYSGLGYHGLGYAGLGYAHGYAAPLAYAHAYAPYGIKGPGYSNDAVGAAGYAAKGQYIANSAGVVHVAKREADPALLYSGLGYAHAAPLAYAHAPVVAVGKSAPCVNAANIPVPCAAGHAVAHVAYAGHYLGKREAEADPALVYSGLGYAGLGYAGLPYATTYAAPLVHSSHVGLCLNYVGQSVPC